MGLNTGAVFLPDYFINRSNYVYRDPSILASFFIVLIPLCDLLLDYPSRIALLINPVKVNQRAVTVTSVVIRLTDTERLLFIVGVAVQSSVGFVPAENDTATLDLIYRCTNNVSVLLTLSPILTFLTRCTTTFTPARSLFVFTSIAAGLSMISISNFFPPSVYTLARLHFIGSLVVTISWTVYCGLILMSAFSYLREKLSTKLNRQDSLMRFLKLFGKSLPNTKNGDQMVDSDSELYTNYIPALHMLASITIACANAAVSYSPNNNLSAIYLNKRYMVLLAEITVLVIELRIRKNEIARGLVRLMIDTCVTCQLNTFKPLNNSNAPLYPYHAHAIPLDRPTGIQEIVRTVHIARTPHASQHGVLRPEAPYKRSEGEQ
jgi:hypothetical protein